MGVALVAALFLSAVGAINIQNAFSQKAASASSGASIKVTGEASKTLDPDQATVTLAVQTQPVGISEIADLHAQQVRIVDSIREAVGDENTTVSIGNSYFNQYYSGPSIPSNTFVGYASIAISSGIDQFAAISEALSNEGFGLESISVSQVPQYSVADASVIIPFGASDQNSLPFEPRDIVVASGSTVTWINQDSALHTATSGRPGDDDAGKLFDTAILGPGDSATVRIDGSPGIIPYYCVLHPFMTGLITISDEEPVSEESDHETKMVVTGYVVINTQPDTLENTIKTTYEKIESVKTILKDAGIDSEKIEPANVSFNPAYYGGPGLGTYTAYTQFIVKTDLSNIDKVVEAARKEGAYLENVYLSISDAAIDKARVELNQLAFANAQERADEIAQPLGLKVGNVKSIEVNASPSGNPYGIVTYRGVNIVPPYYNTQGQQVSVTMTAEFELR